MNRGNKIRIRPAQIGVAAGLWRHQGYQGPQVFCVEDTYVNAPIEMGVAKQAHVHISYSPDWVASVPGAIQELADAVAQRQKQELKLHLLEMVVNELKTSVLRLQSLQPQLVAINTFAPEPYKVLKPIMVSLNPVEDGYNACWIDVNVHSSGDNEEEAVSNLKSLILDFVDGLAKEPTAKLGPEPKRQLAILNEFIRKSP